MTVEDYLRWERRMAADFNRDVAPLGIEDVEGVVVHIGHRLLGFDVTVCADVPHRRLGTAYQNQKQALRDIGLCQVFFGQLGSVSCMDPYREKSAKPQPSAAKALSSSLLTGTLATFSRYTVLA